MAYFLLTVLGCNDDPGQAQIVRTPSEETVRDWTTTEGRVDLQWFARASLDIRGFRPSAEELEWATTNTDSMVDVLDEWLSDPGFAHQQAWYWNDLLHTAVWIGQEDRFTQFELTFEEEQAIGWEPLSYIEQSILRGDPFTAVVTTSAVPSNPVLADIFGDDIQSEQWDLIETDRSHPEAGVIASRILWNRHFVDFLNHNRARANFYTSTFLCHDYLERDVAFDFSQISLDNVETAIRTQSECVTCHASLDPLAAVFGAFQDSINLDLDQMGLPSTFKERWYAGWKEPTYFGMPLNNLTELGAYTAADARFSQCMVEHTWDFFVEDAPLNDLDKYSLAAVFTESNHSMATLVEKVVQSPEYIAQPKRILRPEQLVQTLRRIADLDDEMPNQDQGVDALVWSPEHRVLFGSTDDIGVLSANPAFTVGHHLALEWLVNELATVIAEDVTQQAGERSLLTEWDGSDVSIGEQILLWKRVLHSEWKDVTDSEVQGLINLWENVAREQDERVAWSTILAVLLHDPKAVLR